MNAQQLSFDLPVKPALGRDDFMVAPSNAVAVTMIEVPDSWEGGKLVLCGPEGSGKTHLAHVWTSMHGGRILPACGLSDDDVPALATGPLVIENVPQIAQNAQAQTALFHLHNLMQSARLPLLLTGRGAPRHWAMSLLDLQSRIDAAGVGEVHAPDDALLSAVLAKLFADRQLMPPADVIPYLVLRMDRSFAAAHQLVAQLDQASLSRKTPITRNLAARVVDEINQNKPT